MTQSAISRQIRALEEYLGRDLFRRIKKRLKLTAAGEAYAAQVRDLLDRAEAATLQVMAYSDAGGMLTVGTLPTFGARWLVPRLGDFKATWPDIQLNLITQTREFNFDREGIDIAIHFGDDNLPGCKSHRLMGETLIAVCAPKILKENDDLPIARERVRNCTLLQHSTRPRAWQDWLAATGVWSPRLMSQSPTITPTTWSIRRKRKTTLPSVRFATGYLPPAKLNRNSLPAHNRWSPHRRP